MSEAWVKAGVRADRWMPEDRSSHEAYVLTTAASNLLQAVIIHLQVATLPDTSAAIRCGEFLVAEVSNPGIVAQTLLSSADGRVLAVVKEMESIGRPWYGVVGEPRNGVVMMALLNLPFRVADSLLA